MSFIEIVKKPGVIAAIGVIIGALAEGTTGVIHLVLQAAAYIIGVNGG